jgi:RHS repeat-associated protein
LSQQRGADGSTLRRFTYDGVVPIGMHDATGDWTYHHDALGSIVGVTSATGTSQWSYGYGAYGAATTEQKLRPSAPANPMRYTGQYLDTTGQYHLRARQYDPAISAFTSKDPLRETSPAASSPYAYVGNRPGRLVDPSGLGAQRPGVVSTLAVFGIGMYAGFNTGVPALNQFADSTRDKFFDGAEIMRGIEHGTGVMAATGLGAVLGAGAGAVTVGVGIGLTHYGVGTLGVLGYAALGVVTVSPVGWAVIGVAAVGGAIALGTKAAGMW